MNNTAVITAFTPDFLDQFKLFAASLRRHSRIPLIAVILDDNYKINVASQFNCIEERLDAHNISKYKAIGDKWMQWHKPDIIKYVYTKYDLNTVLWLDVDIIILDDIAPIILNAQQSFTVVKDYFAPATTLNDPLLYQLVDPVNDKEEIPLNSGVIGLQIPRDEYIIDNWIQKCDLIASNDNIKKLISLYDQGTLIWTLKQLDLLQLILDKPEWNHAPIRNIYDTSNNKSWPYGPKPMGGDLFDEIKYDNSNLNDLQNVIIAHYAGHPKITNLLRPEHPQTIKYINHYNATQRINTSRIFVVGLERAGTHSIAELFRRSALHPSWIRHESDAGVDPDNYILAESALNKYRGVTYDKSAILKRINQYKRSDTSIVCDSNHRLGFFVDLLHEHIKDSKLIFMLRSPIQLLKSKLSNYCIWTSLLSHYPISYQMDLFNLHVKFGDGSANQNQHRIFPADVDTIHDWQADIIHKHVWEITETVDYTMSQLSALPNDSYQVLWLDDLPNQIHQLEKLIGAGTFDYKKMIKLSSMKYGCSNTTPNTKSWINQVIDDNIDHLLNQFNNVISKYRLSYPEQVNL